MIRRALLLPAALLLLPGLLDAASRPSFDDLVANLKSPNAKTRQEAAAELGKSRRREAVTPLAALVRDPEFKVRLEVVKALRELRDLSGVPALVTLLGDGDPEIREETTSALVEIYAERERTGTVGRFLKLFSDEADPTKVAAYVQVEPGVHDGLAKGLRDESASVREASALRARHPRRFRQAEGDRRRLPGSGARRAGGGGDARSGRSARRRTAAR